MAILECALDLRPSPTPTPDAADPGPDAGMPARLARLVRPGNDGQARGEVERLPGERAEGVAGHPLDAHD
jgi:hypothetical protein